NRCALTLAALCVERAFASIRTSFFSMRLSLFRLWGCCPAFAEGTDTRGSYDANPGASPYEHSAARILQSGQRAGAVPGIDPAAQRGPRGPKTVDDRSRVGALLYVHSFVGGMGRRSAICK